MAEKTAADSGAPRGSEADSADDGLSQLRGILVGPEQDRLDGLQHRLDDPTTRAQELSEVLAEAIRIRASRDGQLRRDLQPIVEEAIQISVRKNPWVLTDALFPLIGSAIRRNVSAALAAMVHSLNQIAEKGLSLRSLRWRFEALRTGKSFGEIALLRSLLYRVEEVFLIHKETGLLLLHEKTSGGVVEHADLVSSMLTAIRDFVRDSFGAPDTDELETIRVGEYNLWIQQGPQALLAGVVHGNPPLELKTVFQKALEKIHGEQMAALDEFAGDAARFEACRPALRSCLLGQAAPRRRWRFSTLWLIPAVLAALIVFGGVRLFENVRDQRRLDTYVERLNSEPGLVVTSAEKRGGRYVLLGLRDPLAADPDSFLPESGLPPQSLTAHWIPFNSSHPAFEAVRELKRRIDTVQSYRIYFETGSSKILATQADTIERSAAAMKALFQAGEAAGHPDLLVALWGSTDWEGTPEANAVLAAGRAENVRRALVARGIPEDRCTLEQTVPEGSPEPANVELEGAVKRSVSFRVIGGPAGLAGEQP